MPVALAEQQKSSATKNTSQNMSATVDELVVFCPKCKTLEMLYFTGERLMPTRKFHQEDGKVYHGCGSSEPCRLYRFS